MQLMRSITKELFNRVCGDPKWMFLFLGAAQAHLISYLYGSYLVLWLNSFVETGGIETHKEVEMVFSRMTLYSIPSTLFTIFLTGYLADLVKPIYMIIPAFIGRSITCYCFKLIEDP